MEMILESVVFVLFVRLNFFLDCFDCSDKYHVTKINRKGIIWLTYLNHSSPLRELRAGAKGRNWSRHHGGTRPTDFFSMTYLACFLIYHRITCSGVTVSWAVSRQSSIRIMSYRLAYRPVWWMAFPSRGYFLLDDSTLCQIDYKKKKKPISTKRHVKD